MKKTGKKKKHTKRSTNEGEEDTSQSAIDRPAKYSTEGRQVGTPERFNNSSVTVLRGPPLLRGDLIGINI